MGTVASPRVLLLFLGWNVLFGQGRVRTARPSSCSSCAHPLSVMLLEVLLQRFGYDPAERSFLASTVVSRLFAKRGIHCDRVHSFSSHNSILVAADRKVRMASC